jgi:hypothetical protein
MAQLPKNIDVSKISYSEMRTLQSGAKTVPLFFGSDRLTIQTPVMSVPPYGLSEPFKVKEAIKKGLPINDSDKQYDINLTFKGIDENPKIKNFHDKLKEIEDKIIDDAFKNRAAWFNKKVFNDRMQIATMFSPIVRVDPAGKYPASFKARLPYDVKNNSFMFDAYDMDNNELSFQEIMTKLKGARVQLIVQLTGLWFSGGMFGTSWRVVSGKFQLHQNTKITFIEDSDTEKVAAAADTDDEDIVDNDALLLTAAKKTTPPPVMVQDEDEEEFGEEDEEVEEDEDEEEDDEPPKPVKKTPNTPPPAPKAEEPPKLVKKTVKKVAK